MTSPKLSIFISFQLPKTYHQCMVYLLVENDTAVKLKSPLQHPHCTIIIYILVCFKLTESRSSSKININKTEFPASYIIHPTSTLVKSTNALVNMCPTNVLINQLANILSKTTNFQIVSTTILFNCITNILDSHIPTKVLVDLTNVFYGVKMFLI